MQPLPELVLGYLRCSQGRELHGEHSDRLEMEPPQGTPRGENCGNPLGAFPKEGDAVSWVDFPTSLMRPFNSCLGGVAQDVLGTPGGVRGVDLKSNHFLSFSSTL